MTKATKAALLSAFVFPGLGQCYLKCYGRGILLIILMVIGLGALIIRTTIAALDTLKAVQGDGSSIDINAITHLAENTSASISSDNTAILILLVILWGYSVVDAYLIGKRGVSNNTTEGK